jgi:hypothetical protein
MRLTARPRYGAPVIDHALFPHKPVDRFRSIVVRSAGQDQETKIKDVLGTQLVRDTHVDFQDHRAVVVYLNGRYWGVQGLREHIDAHTLAAEHGLVPDDITLVRGKDAEHGDREAFRELLAFVRSHDLAIAGNYERVASRIDIDSYVDWQSAEIYAGNLDNGNVRCWRGSGPEARWRWILYDLDDGFADVAHDTVSYALEPDGGGDGAQPLLFLKLVQNADFRDRFLVRFAWHLDHTFAPDRVLAEIDALASAMEAEMPRHFLRWPGDFDAWRRHVGRLRVFARQRPDVLREHVRVAFGLSAADLRRYGFAR